MERSDKALLAAYLLTGDGRPQSTPPRCLQPPRKSAWRPGRVKVARTSAVTAQKGRDATAWRGMARPAFVVVFALIEVEQKAQHSEAKGF
jgi:hypothetical protein